MECLTSRLPGKRRTRRRVSWVPLLEATEGLLSIVPAGMDEPDVSLHPRAQEQKFIFELTGDSMVNLWVPGASSRDLTLRLSGKTLEQPLISKKSGLSGGESISLRLPKGVYTFTIADLTDYAHVLNGSTLKQINFHPETNMKIDPYNSADIEGRVSIDGSKEVMPVSMRVAEFITDENNEVKRKTDYDLDPKNGGVSKLDPSKPVWVVIHGMDSDPKASVMNELTKALHAYNKSSGIQVVTIDWNEAAASGFLMTQDAPWTVPIGKWIAQQFMNLGFQAHQIDVGAWSHGTFVGYEMGQELKKSGGEINTFVALDAARNLPLISGYDHSPNFSEVSTQSIAFDSSVIAGDDALATTADYSFMVRSNEISPTVRHRLAVTTFTAILSHERENPGQFSQVINFDKLMNGMTSAGIFEKNVFLEGFEGCIDIGVREENIDNDTYYRALPSVMGIVRPHDSQETFLQFHQRIMSTTKRVFIGIVSLFLLPIWLPFILGLFGYHVNRTGSQVAKYIVEHKQNVEKCHNIIFMPWEVFSPPASEQRWLCVHEYASLTKDPSACELLMPSSYGLSCVGGAESQPDLCSMSDEKVAWHDGKETYASCADLTKKRTSNGNACCLIARVSFVKSENDCSPLRNLPDMHDECLQSLAFKNHDPTTCDDIANENRKSACLVNAKAIRANPSICEGCKQAVNQLKDFN